MKRCRRKCFNIKVIPQARKNKKKRTVYFPDIYQQIKNICLAIAIGHWVKVGPLDPKLVFYLLSCVYVFLFVFKK